MMMLNQSSGKALTLVVAATLLACTAVWMSMVSIPAAAEQNGRPDSADLRAGRNFLATKVYSEQEDQEILKLFEGLRVSEPGLRRLVRQICRLPQPPGLAEDG